MRRRRRTKTRGGQRREGAPAAAVPNDARRLACAAATCGERREWVVATGVHGSGSATHRRGRGDGGVETVGSAQTSPVGTVDPLKALGAVVFNRCVALGVQRPPTGGSGWRE
jgi:hypothetical protein